jgi:hypothetical protein
MEMSGTISTKKRKHSEDLQQHEQKIDGLLNTNWGNIIQDTSNSLKYIYVELFKKCIEARLLMYTSETTPTDPTTKDQRRPWPKELTR